MTKYRILVIDDEEVLCEILQYNLEQEGYEVDVAYSAEDALKLPLASYDLLLVDVMLGGMSGFQLARRLKSDEATARVPIIFCTARDDEDAAVTGLNLGADDYIRKPFSLREVKARVRAALRRAAPREGGRIVFGELTIDRAAKTCTLAGKPLALTRKELDLLTFLLAHAGTVFSREEILKNVWPEQVVVLDRTIDVNITRLRRKIGPYGHHIITRQGYGYGWQA